MQPRSMLLRVVVLLATVSAASCGDSGTGPTPVATTIEIANGTLVLTEALSSSQLLVTVRDQDGQAMSGVTPTFQSSQPDRITVNASGVVTGLRNGSANIAVSAGTANASASVTVDVTPIALVDGTAVTGLSGPVSSERYYSFQVGPPATDQVLEIRTLGGSGDADLYVRFGARLDGTSVDCQSLSFFADLDNLDACFVPAPAPGTWHMAVHGFSAYSGARVQASLRPLVTLTSGAAVSGIAASRLQFVYFTISTPNGATLDLATAGGTGDADLFAAPGPPGYAFSFAQAYTFPCASYSDTSTEVCSVDTGTAGTWTVVLFAFETFDGVTLTATITP